MARVLPASVAASARRQVRSVTDRPIVALPADLVEDVQ